MISKYSMPSNGQREVIGECKLVSLWCPRQPGRPRLLPRRTPTQTGPQRTARPTLCHGSAEKRSASTFTLSSWCKLSPRTDINMVYVFTTAKLERSSDAFFPPYLVERKVSPVRAGCKFLVAKEGKTSPEKQTRPGEERIERLCFLGVGLGKLEAGRAERPGC